MCFDGGTVVLYYDVQSCHIIIIVIIMTMKQRYYYIKMEEEFTKTKSLKIK